MNSTVLSPDVDTQPFRSEARPTAAPVRRTALFPILDAMRGVAVLGVVAFHASFSDSFREQLPFLYQITRSGYLGVAIFFVISGYCLAASGRKSLDKGDSAGSFIQRRLWRVYPPLWCSILLLAPLPYLKQFVTGRQGTEAAPLYASFTPTDWLATATLTQAFRRPDVPINEKFDQFNVVYWTLALEVQFYLVVGVGLLLKRWYTGVLCAVTALGVYCEVEPAAKSYCLASGWFLPWWPMFAWGLLLYEARMRNWTLRRVLPGRAAMILAGVALTGLTCAVAAYLGQGNRLTEHRAAFIFAMGLWLYDAVDFEPRTKSGVPFPLRVLSQPAFALGLISYSVYLIHFNLHKIPRLALERFIPLDSIAMDLLVVVSTCLLCVPFYLLCERPFISTTSKGRALTAPNPAELSSREAVA